MGRPDGRYWTRREFLGRLTLAGAAGFVGFRPPRAYAEAPPEVRRIRIAQLRGLCVAPQYVAEELLRAEGFEEVQYVQETEAFGTGKLQVTGDADVGLGFAGPVILRVDAGEPLRILAGVHSGCFELFGNERVRQVRDLRGKTVAVASMGDTPHVFVSVIAAYVGLDPRKDIRWLVHPAAEWGRLLAEGKIDAFLGFPPIPQEARAKKIGHVILNSTLDRPWSHSSAA